MRGALAAVGCLVLLVFTVPVRAAGPAPVRLSPEARERLARAAPPPPLQDGPADGPPDSRAAGPALLLAAEQASQAGDDAGAVGLWRRFLDRFPDHALAPRARLRMGQSLSASGRSGEAAVAYRDLWLFAPG